MGYRKCLIAALLLILLQASVDSYSLPFRPELNCSHYCTCRVNALVSTMKQYNIKHFAIMGKQYRPELDYFDVKSEYMTFLGTFAPVLHRIVEITCAMFDGMSHSVMEILNGIDDQMYTALDIKCHNGESIIWDVPSWHVSVNIFVSEKCNVLPSQKIKEIVIPMNMWIFYVENPGLDMFELLDTTFTMNTLTLAVTGSRALTIPQQWSNKYLVSSAVISLRDNFMEEFNCPFQFTKRLDTLNLEGNKLSHFPACVLLPKNMQMNYLSLANNIISDIRQIYEVPADSGTPDINIINLSFNQIRSVEAIRDMGNLFVLDLSHNAIMDITEDAFDNLTELEVLYLNFNKIHALGPRQFANNKKLGILDLSHNFLLTIAPEQLPGGTYSLTLDVRQNKLIYPPFRDCATKTLHNLNLKIYSEGNPFFCDCKMIEFENCQKWVEQNMLNQTRRHSIFIDTDSMICAAPSEVKDISLNEIFFHDLCTVIDDCPQLCTCTLLRMDKLVINCSNRRLLEMPDTIPSYPNASTVLYLDHNPLQMLNNLPYLTRLSELYVDNCKLASITPAAMLSLQDIRVLTLHNNQLQKLPLITRNVTLNRARNVTLHNNCWACTCDNLWMPRWITKHKSSLWMPGNIACCYFRKPVEELTEADLNCSSTSYVDKFLAVCLFLVSLVSTIVMITCYRSEISVLLYSKLGLQLDYSFSYVEFFNPLDAFISYSQENRRWVTDIFVPKLEKRTKKYRLFLHQRDLYLEDSVIENLPWAIRSIRSVILVLSKNVLKKEWSILEVRATIKRLNNVANKLAILAVDDININELPYDMRDYMNCHEYFKATDPFFWDKLEMFLLPREATQEDKPELSAVQANPLDITRQNSADMSENNRVADPYFKAAGASYAEH